MKIRRSENKLYIGDKETQWKYRWRMLLNSVFLLPSDRFPRYINEIVCNGGICLRNEGVCAQKMFSMTLLRKTGNCVPITDGRNTVYIEEWAPYQQNIRTCCECQLKKNSFLTMFVK